jgi:hypothetical protein
MPSAYAPAPACSFLTRQRVADQPDRRRPQPDEQRTALGVAALVLVDGLGALPPEFPDGVDETEVLGAADGRGPLFHRRYRTQIREARLNASSLMLELKRDVNQAAPTKSSFRLATLEGHLEAGQIEFRVLAAEPMVFEIESWARSADRFADLLYHRARMAKEIQLHMWVWSDLARQPNSGPLVWNFTKYLVGADGKLIARWPTKVTPEDPRIRVARRACFSGTGFRPGSDTIGRAR